MLKQNCLNLFKCKLDIDNKTRARCQKKVINFCKILKRFLYLTETSSETDNKIKNTFLRMFVFYYLSLKKTSLRGNQKSTKETCYESFLHTKKKQFLFFSKINIQHLLI